MEKAELLAAVEEELSTLKGTQSSSVTNNMTFDSPESFVRQLWSMAEKAAKKIGVRPEVILSQAALETGWGKHVIAKTDHASSHNLFNIKADARWEGEATSIGTVEYRNGIAVKEQAKFRVYASYQDSFNDYIHFLQTQPRYQEALQNTADPEAFIEGLHKAGYATDPAYADKVKRIMNSDTLAGISPPSVNS
jgi:flagellar protein FlgJ